MSESACVNNFIEDYLRNKYHECCPQFRLVSEHEGGTLHTTRWTAPVGERVGVDRDGSGIILRKNKEFSEYNTVDLWRRL